MNNICARCVMDTSAQGFFLDENGICNYCNDFFKKDPLVDAGTEADLVKFVTRSNSKYDCVVGVSGGVDSSYVLVRAVQLGLRPLAVHMDNGWNSELSQNNISNLVRILGVDLYTYVIDWSEYKGLMQSFFDANVIDIELLYDNAMLEVNYRIAKKFGIKTILAGTNKRTEGMGMPKNWGWFKMDGMNIRSIGKQFGIKSFATYPLFTFNRYLVYKYFHKINWISALDYMNYDKNKALKLLESEFGYKRYPYKHYESIFTRFYQGFILPNKFGVDKRRLHLSTLIMTNQMSRDEAIHLISQDPYPNAIDKKSDFEYFLSKMDFTEKKFLEYLAAQPVSHMKFDSELWKYRLASWILSWLR